MDAVIRSSETQELLQYKTWYIDAATQWLDIPVFNLDSEDQTQVYLSYGILAHLGTFMLAAFALLVHVLRRVCDGMKIEIKYTEVIKKFESGTPHLALYPQDDELNINRGLNNQDKDEERQKLLVDEAPNNSAFEKSVEMKRVSEHETEEDVSEESHYIEDEDGVITRTMIKKVKQSAAPHIGGVNQIFTKSEIDDRSNTFKDGLSGGNSRINLDIDGFSEKTLDGKRVKNKIKKSYIGNEEMCEEPPEFISESGNYADIMNRSIE